MTAPRWLAWAKQVQALAQSGLHYTEGAFDRERYLALRRIAAEMMAAYGGSDPEQVEGLFAVERGYATPKVDVRAVVFRDGKLLLVRERDDGCWSLPGGWADVGSSPREVAEKEVREETGYRVRAVRLLAVYDRDRHGHPPLPWYVYKLFILCELEGGEPADSIETDGAEFFGEHELPSLSLSRVMPAELHRMWEYLRNPDLPTDFD